ncbi:MAG: hypothetical protein J0L62_05290 [Bacteroidetes bacterium]|nr:hypothetical protein [Bacteroidota bacterium]
MKHFFSMLAFLVYGSMVFAQTNDFIMLKNGTQITGSFTIDRSIFGGTIKSFIIDADKKVISPSTVMAYQENGNYYAKSVGSNTFLERTLKGKIELFSTSSTYTKMSSTGAMSTTTTVSEYFRVDNGPIEELSDKKLRKIMADTPEAIALLDKDRKLTYWTYGLIGGGIVTTIVAGVNVGKDDKFPTPGIIAGLAIAISSWIPSLMNDDYDSKAIRVYNEKHK